MGPHIKQTLIKAYIVAESMYEQQVIKLKPVYVGNSIKLVKLQLKNFPKAEPPKEIWKLKIFG